MSPSGALEVTATSNSTISTAPNEQELCTHHFRTSMSTPLSPTRRSILRRQRPEAQDGDLSVSPNARVHFVDNGLPQHEGSTTLHHSRPRRASVAFANAKDARGINVAPGPLGVPGSEAAWLRSVKTTVAVQGDDQEEVDLQLADYNAVSTALGSPVKSPLLHEVLGSRTGHSRDGAAYASDSSEDLGAFISRDGSDESLSRSKQFSKLIVTGHLLALR